MKNGDLSNHAVVWGWVIITAVVLGVGLFPPDDGGDVAAWVQGLGTIAAVAAAIFYPEIASARASARTRRTVAQETAAILNDMGPELDNMLKQALAGDTKGYFVSSFAVQKGRYADDLSILLQEGGDCLDAEIRIQLRRLCRDLTALDAETALRALKSSDFDDTQKAELVKHATATARRARKLFATLKADTD